ncbi:carbon-nitrogen hydrolase [Aspergillus bertholletiae]|uniref:Carbon-nitrogen hydrolase n=1 Tax=Aspergillus bertholletiae TaxID=1226010 RepID=A0A5N7BI17_9EURO|nr:carbon-nitrogen hydrolase [Aspergillus bertholletiae]
MRIATLQFAPKLGDVEGNIRRANELLQNGKMLGDAGRVGVDVLKPEILILPELALTGYNFPSLEAIKPYLEPAGKGPSAAWARETAQRYRCKVCVGYPEVEEASVSPGDGSNGQRETYYNSLLVVDENGEVLHNYRKTFLYYTDETWAAEGDAERSFHELTFGNSQEQDSLHSNVATSFGICMDINPYKFQTPFTACEFANRVLDSKSQLVILSMAWLTAMDREELVALDGGPEMDTWNYWIQRFGPLVEKRLRHEVNFDGDDAESGKRIIIVFANRSGEEPGPEGTNPVLYAGTSTIMAVTQRPRRPSADGETSAVGKNSGNRSDEDESGDKDTSPFDVKLLCWDVLPAAAEGICFADTTADPELVFGLAKRR